jgi:hypothetical protein
MLSRALASLVLLLFAVASLAAQAPRITPQGDPSVRADTIYKLAVNPADYPEESAAFLLDDGVVRFEPDGRGTRTYRQIVQILRPEGADRYREHSFSYQPKHERFTLNWIRVVKPDGTVISEKPSHLQESDVPAEMGDPVYNDQKVVRASITGVEPGTIVDYSYTTEELKPFLPRDFYMSWGVSTGLSVKRSRYIVDVPASLSPRIAEENLNFARKETTANGRRVYVWATHDLPKLKPEPFAADSNGVYMSVLVSAPITWSDIGKWYADNARGRYALTPATEAKLSAAVAGAKTLDDSIRLVHRWVAQDVRYVSIALGLGGYQPRTPGEVTTTGFGDCKDKATLFIAALSRFGVTAYPVILNSQGGVKRTLPSISQFDHVIAAIQRPGASGYQFVDLTADLVPLGELPYDEQGAFGLVVHPDGTTEEVTFPKAPIEANRSETRVVGTLAADGTFSGRYEELAAGARQYALRAAFANPLDSTQRVNVANAIARKMFEGADGDSLVGFAGKDLTAAPRVSLRITGGKAATSAGNSVVLTNPLGSMGGMATSAKELEALPPGRFPIDPAKFLGDGVSVFEIRLTLADGWRAQLPANVTATSAFGSYTAKYEQVGRELRMTRRISGATAIQPPSERKALITWMRQIARDDAKLIVIETGGSSGR